MLARIVGICLLLLGIRIYFLIEHIFYFSKREGLSKKEIWKVFKSELIFGYIFATFFWIYSIYLILKGEF